MSLFFASVDFEQKYKKKLHEFHVFTKDFRIK